MGCQMSQSLSLSVCLSLSLLPPPEYSKHNLTNPLINTWGGGLNKSKWKGISVKYLWVSMIFQNKLFLQIHQLSRKQRQTEERSQWDWRDRTTSAYTRRLENTAYELLDDCVMWALCSSNSTTVLRTWKKCPVLEIQNEGCMDKRACLNLPSNRSQKQREKPTRQDANNW